MIKLNIEVFNKTLEWKHWSPRYIAEKLGISESFLNRVTRGERNLGGKFLTGLIELCDEEGLDFWEFIEVKGNKPGSDILAKVGSNLVE